jgi:outer membrane protein TolC
VGASSLAIAGLLGACASTPAPGPSPVVGAQAKGGLDSLPVIGPLKNAESAFADYARAWHREAGLRETVQAASDAALVARHRQSIGSTDFLVAAAAESRLAVARRELKAGEAATRAARVRLHRALGMNDSGLAQVSLPGAAKQVPPATPL